MPCVNTVYSDGYPAGPPDYISELLEYLEGLEDAAIEYGDDEVKYKIVHRLVSGMLQIKQLLNAFQKAPNRKVAEVAMQLELSVPGTYMRLAMVGFDPADFADTEARFDALIQRSPVFSPIARIVMESQGQYLLLLNLLEASDPREIFIDWKEFNNLNF